MIAEEGRGSRELALTDHHWLPARLPQAARAPAEYAFANLFLFRERHRYRIEKAPVLHLSGLTYDGQRHALPLVPLNASIAAALLENHDCLFPFGQEGPAIAEALGLACSFTDDDSDYIYDAARLATLEGAKKRRAQARAFASAQSPTYHRLAERRTGELEMILAGWREDVGRDLDATDLAECHEALDLADTLELEGALVRTGAGEPAAFLLASRRDDGEHVVHFAKGRRTPSGAYPWMFAHYASASGAVRLNFEQDLGKPGFAQSKHSYAPSERRLKHRLTHRRPITGI